MEARWISKDLMHYFKERKHVEAKVHSIFNNAFNIITQEGDFFSVLAEDKDIEPMSMLVTMHPSELKGMHQDERVSLSEEGIFFKNNPRRVMIQSAKVWHPEILLKGHLNSFEAQKKRLEAIKRVLYKSDVSSGLSPLIHYFTFDEGVQLLKKGSPVRNMYCDFIQIRLYQLLKALQDKAYKEALTLVPNFIGFGPGLTPSSDDVLAGILVSLSYEEGIKDRPLKNQSVEIFTKGAYEASVGKTTYISEQMLKFASRGMISEGYRSLIRCILFEDTLPISVHIEKALKHGASSGSDFLFGIYCMNAIRLNSQIKECDQ